MADKENPQLCMCGCNEFVIRGQNGNWNKYIHGHNTKNKPSHRRGKVGVYSERTLAAMRSSHIGIKKTKQWRDNLSAAITGTIRTSEQKIKMALSHMKHDEMEYCGAWYDKEYKADLRKSYCENCGITKMMNFHLFDRSLHTHHKNGKKECAPSDIQTLCISCHLRLHNKIRRQKGANHGR